MLLKWKMDFCLEMTLNLQQTALRLHINPLSYIKDKSYNNDAILDNNFTYQIFQKDQLHYT